jgi:hypothetical protein
MSDVDPPPSPASPLSYRSGPEARADYVTADHRSARKWVMLCIVWIVGLGVWGLYIAMIILLVYRWFGGGGGPRP